MTASIHEKKGYLYIVLFYKGSDNEKKRKWVSTGLKERGNKKKAEALIDETIRKYNYLEENSDSTLFVNCITDWLEEKKGTIRQSTWETYSVNVERHILPYFKPLGLHIQDVKPRMIKDFYSYLAADGSNYNNGKGLHSATIRKISSILKMIFSEAVLLEEVSSNPVLNVKVSKRTEEATFKGKFLTADEAREVLKAFDGHELKPMFYVDLYYGLRRSELLGLKWDAIDFEKNTIEIKHTITQVKTTVAADTTKTEASHRTLYLLPDVRNALLDLKSKQDENRKIFGNAYKDSDYIFTHKDGSLIRPDSATRSFKRVLKAHGIPEMRLHDLRHTTASILYDMGWELKDVQEWLGHADIETTANIYTHISKQRKMLKADSLTGTFSL